MELREFELAIRRLCDDAEAMEPLPPRVQVGVAAAKQKLREAADALRAELSPSESKRETEQMLAAMLKPAALPRVLQPPFKA